MKTTAEDAAISTDLVVIGAGPAGLMAAIRAAGDGIKTMVLEAMPKPGLKLLASGGGRCNLTNTLGTAALAKRFGARAAFVSPALKKWPTSKLRQFFTELGVETHAPDGFHVFPADHRAASVHQALVQHAQDLGIVIKTKTQAQKIIREENYLVVTQKEPGAEIRCKAVILATGGQGFSKLGGSTSGYRLATLLGHKVISPVPAMLALNCQEPWPARCTADTLGKAKLRILDSPSELFQGDIIFTKTGLAGPLILDLAGDFSSRLQQSASVGIEICPSGDNKPASWRSQLDDAITSTKQTSPTAESKPSCLHWLQNHLPTALAQVVLEHAQLVPQQDLADLSQMQREALVYHLCWLPLTITGHGGFEQAMVTRGGVDIAQVDRRSLASRVFPGVFFAGELLDVDGPCGGYNLQWAFSSGNLAGLSAAAWLQNP